jgi:sulfite reductase alpha subunit-like flavoprotein
MSMVAYAVLAVGDTDAMPERAMYRSKQNTAGDCNQAGQLADKVMKQLGGERMCPRGEIDVARDQVERDVAAFIDKKLLPALVP